MKRSVVAIALFVLIVSTPVVWGQAYPTPPLPVLEEGSLSDTQGLLQAEEERLERLNAEVAVQEALLLQAEKLLGETRKAARASVTDLAVDLAEDASYARVVRRAEEVLGVVRRRLDIFREEVAGAEREIARLRRAVLRLELAAEADRIKEAVGGK